MLLSFCISAFLYLFYDVEQLNYKSRASRDIHASKRLETLKLSRAEFEKTRGENEVWVDGSLYDISSYTINNDTVFITVLHDVDEQSLVQTLADSFEPNDNYIADGFLHLDKHRVHLPSDFKILASAPSFSLAFTPAVGHRQWYYRCAMATYSASVVKPPPDAFFV